MYREVYGRHMLGYHKNEDGDCAGVETVFFSSFPCDPVSCARERHVTGGPSSWSFVLSQVTGLDLELQHEQQSSTLIPLTRHPRTTASNTSSIYSDTANVQK